MLVSPSLWSGLNISHIHVPLNRPANTPNFDGENVNYYYTSLTLIVSMLYNVRAIQRGTKAALVTLTNAFKTDKCLEHFTTMLV